ncbi:hypothetical protein JTE90_003913 [Oedothorax gibbosus]|uniref:Uncharacterized protein n=1 Tax=Oedothorax gibbosus TaxID=931172 RepID=A0AAV6TMC3_9ARAC|nr:hypothetical protein JTE90_003913 [Oedothorax gibbosus]
MEDTDCTSIPLEALDTLLIDCHFKYGKFCPSDAEKALQIHREYVTLLKTLFESQDMLKRIQQDCDDWNRITYAPEPEPISSCHECRDASLAVQEEYNERLANCYDMQERWLHQALDAIKSVVTKLECQWELAVSRTAKANRPHAIRMVAKSHGLWPGRHLLPRRETSTKDLQVAAPEEDARQLVEASYDPFKQLLTDVFVQILQNETNIHLTYETIVIRILKTIAELYRLSWNNVLETTRQIYIDSKLQNLLLHCWNQRTKVFTLEEQHCIERILGRDHVRISDLIKFAGCAHKVFLKPRDLWWWFGMDGFLGEDPKRYVDSSFRFDKNRHVEAVRTLLEKCPEITTLDVLKETIQAIFRGEEHAARYVYLDTVGGLEAVKWIIEIIDSKLKKMEGEGNKKRKGKESKAGSKKLKSGEGASADVSSEDSGE